MDNSDNFDIGEKGGCSTFPPPSPFPPPVPPAPYPQPIPPGMTVMDWLCYINAYIDVRARQIYDRLKKLIPGGGSPSGETKHDYILLKDVSDSTTHKVYIRNGVLHSEPVLEG